MIADDGYETARDEFILLYFADLDRGLPRTEEEYRRLFPGAEDEISSELRRIEDRLAGTSVEPPTLPSRDTTKGAEIWSLGRYRIEHELGRGGQGTVFLAMDTVLGRQVAIKVLKASWSGSSTLVRRFEREAQALARLEHVGFATVHDVGSAHGLEYLVMQYVEGRTLAQEIADRKAGAIAAPLTRAEVNRYLHLIEKTARSLHAAHEAGLVHRDVKPGNIMITQEGEPIVLDFGIAHFRDAEAENLTVTGDLIGTPGFMAPEQIAGERNRVDRRTDVYALAATLRAIVGGARRIHAAMPRDLEAVLQAGLEPDPDRRYATAAALADEVERVRLGLPVQVRPPGPASKAALWIRRAPASAALVLLLPLALFAGLIGLEIKNEEIRKATRELERREAEADAVAGLATARFKDYQRLNDLRSIQELDERAMDLWPSFPAMAPSMERWLADAGELLYRLEEHRAALAALRERGRAAILRKPGVDPEMDQLLRCEWIRDAAIADLDTAPPSSDRRANLSLVLEESKLRIEHFERAVASRPSYHFDSTEDQWLHDHLAELVSKLEALDRPSRHGCTRASMKKRLEEARSLERISLLEAAAGWQEAVEALADPTTDPAYDGLRIEPILGLIPLGRDPRSSLWEFAHVLSGAVPARDSSGNLVITEETSIVLVLIPGLVSRMGARRPVDEGEAADDHVDPAAQSHERPVHDVPLDAFFISKYEMTQGQWLRATGSNPSAHRPDRSWDHDYRPNLRHPVEGISFEDCEEILRRLGLTLPTEAQWELAARAGTSTPWWPGETTESFLAFENLADSTWIETESVVHPHDPERRDGWSGPAPVGSYPANPFGLHDVIGNVAEWCLDRIDSYRSPALPGDGLRPDPEDDLRAIRGGAFNSPAVYARSAHRQGQFQTGRFGTIGVRPALNLR